MDGAAAAGDSTLFIQSARTALQRGLASRWKLEPDAVTPEEMRLRLGETSDVARIFMLADEAAYAGLNLSASEFQWCKQVVLRRINSEAVT